MLVRQRLYNAAIREDLVAGIHLLLVEHHFVEDSRPLYMDSPAGDGAVRVEPDLSRLTHDGTSDKRKKIVSRFSPVPSQVRGVSDVCQQRQHGLAHAGGRVGVRPTFVTNGGQQLVYFLICE